jgi:hypothetical protein
LDATRPPPPIADIFAINALQIRVVVDARHNPHRLKAALDCVPQIQVETPYIDELLIALTTVDGHHLIAARDESQTFGLIEVR